MQGHTQADGMVPASEVATRLNVHKDTILNLISSGRLLSEMGLRHRRVGGQWRINAADLDAFVNSSEGDNA